MIYFCGLEFIFVGHFVLEKVSYSRRTDWILYVTIFSYSYLLLLKLAFTIKCLCQPVVKSSIDTLWIQGVNNMFVILFDYFLKLWKIKLYSLRYQIKMSERKNVIHCDWWKWCSVLFVTFRLRCFNWLTPVFVSYYSLLLSFYGMKELNLWQCCWCFSTFLCSKSFPFLCWTDIHIRIRYVIFLFFAKFSSFAHF